MNRVIEKLSEDESPKPATIAKDLPTADICRDSGGGNAESDTDGGKQTFDIIPALFTFILLQRYLQLNRTRVYALIRQGKFPKPIKIGKSSRWLRSDVDDWIAAQSRSTAAQG